MLGACSFTERELFCISPIVSIGIHSFSQELKFPHSQNAACDRVVTVVSG